MKALRHWSVRHAAGLKRVYDAGARVALHLRRPLQWLGTRRMERVLRPLERATKQLLVDCKMCGQCVLSSTGMACPTNCAKQMRNGPCGGVRDDGHCEVIPSMKCVWVAAYEGSRRIPGGVEKMQILQVAVDQRLQGSSSWLRVVREKTGAAT